MTAIDDGHPELRIITVERTHDRPREYAVIRLDHLGPKLIEGPFAAWLTAWHARERLIGCRYDG